MLQKPRYYFFNEFNQFEEQFNKIKVKNERFSKGDYLMKSDEMLGNCYYIVSGMVKFSIFSESGFENSISFYGSGSIIPLIVSELKFTLEPFLTAIAISEVEAITISSQGIINLIKNSPDFALAAFDHYERYANLLLVRNIFSSDFDSFAKVSSYLMLHISSFPNRDNKITIKQEEIASIVEITRVQVSRVLTQLRNQQILKTNRNEIQIINKEKLKELSASFVDY